MRKFIQKFNLKFNVNLNRKKEGDKDGPKGLRFPPPFGRSFVSFSLASHCLAPVLVGFGLLFAPTNGAMAGQQNLFPCSTSPQKVLRETSRWIWSFHHTDPSEFKAAGEPMPEELGNRLSFGADGFKRARDPLTGEPYMQISYEGVLRPRHSDKVHLLHLITFSMKRARNLNYFCLKYDSRYPERSQFTLHFMEAYGLEAKTWSRDDLSTLPFDLLFGPGQVLGPGGLFKSRIAPLADFARVPLRLAPIEYVTDDIPDWLENLPVAGWVLKAPSSVLKLSGAALAQLKGILGLGIQRIRITSKRIDFESHVSSTDPNNSQIVYSLDLAEGEESFFSTIQD